MKLAGLPAFVIQLGLHDLKPWLAIACGHLSLAHGAAQVCMDASSLLQS